MKASRRTALFPTGLALLAVLLLAFGLRLVKLADKPIWWDEGWSVWLARLDFSAIALRTASDEHPPLHYWFLHVWTALAGEDAFVVRFTSVAFGVLTVALLYRFAADLAGRRVALIAAALLTLARFHIIWSQEIKMYAPGVLLALLSCYAFVRLWRSGRWPYAALWAIATWAVLMTLYLGVMVVLAQGLVALVGLLQRRRVGRLSFPAWAGLQAIVAAAYLPWVLTYLRHAYAFESLETFDLASALQLYVTVLPLGISTEITRYRLVVGAAAFGLLAVAGLLAGRRIGTLWLLPAVAVASIPVVLVLFSIPEQAIYQPKISERYMVLFIPLYLLLVAAGLDWMAQRARLAGVAATVAVVTVMAALLPGYFDERRPDYEAPALAYALASQIQPDDLLVLNSDKDWPVYAYYLPVPESRWQRIPHGAAMSPQEADHWLARMGPTGAVWLINTPMAAKTDPRGEVRRWLDDRFERSGEWRFTRSQITLYARDGTRRLGVIPALPAGLAAAAPVEVSGLALGGLGQPPRAMRPGETAYVFSAWEATGSTSRPYQSRVRLVHQDTGASRERRWEPLVDSSPAAPLAEGDRVLAKHLVAVGPSQPPGTYDVVLEVARGNETTTVPVGTVEVVANATAPLAAAAEPPRATFGGMAALVGMGPLPAVVRPGDHIEATWHWEALGETPTSYTVFVQLIGPDGVVWGSGDGLPVDGAQPTTGWAAGDIIEDTHRMWLPDETPPGVYRVVVGFYDAQTGERLAAVDPSGAALDENAAAIGEITVVS